MACNIWIAFTNIGKQEVTGKSACIAFHKPHKEKTVCSKCVYYTWMKISVGKIMITFNCAVR